MTMKLGVPDISELRPRITVFGVGGAGGNAVGNMIAANLEGVEFVVANTDAQALAGSSCERRIQMGASITEGLGAGSRPEIGRAAAEESLSELIDHLSGSHMVFITAGMGGGTGTGAAPIIAQAARDQGILTVGVVTKPFQFEGQRRMNAAEAGIEEFQKYADTLLVIPNQNLFRIANENTTFAHAFSMADEVLHSGVRGITDLMVMPGLINLDFADVRAVMNEMGKAMMGTGESEGEKRAIEAAEAAISNPLLDDVSMKGARGVLINITGGVDLGLYEVDEAANRIRAEVDPNANIIVGSTFDERLEGMMRVSVVATGIDCEEGELTDDDSDHVITPQRQVWSAANATRPSVHEMTETLKEELQVPSEDDVQPQQAPAAEAPQPQPARQPYQRPAAQPQQQPPEEVVLRRPVPQASFTQRVESAPQPQQQPVEQAAPPPVEEKPKSVFDRMMAGVKKARSANGLQSRPRTAPIVPQAQPQAPPQATQQPQPAPQPRRAPAAPQARAAQAQPQAQPQAPQSQQKPGQSQDDLFSVTEEEEQLEIPAFLRRQAN